MTEAAKKHNMKKFTWRGKNLEDLLTLTKPDGDKIITDELLELFDQRVRRSIKRGMEDFKFKKFVERVRKSKRNTQPGEKPAPVKTQSRHFVVLPEFVGGVISIYNGRNFTPIEIKFDMIGKYFGEFAMSYKPTAHGRPGVGSTKGSAHTK